MEDRQAAVVQKLQDLLKQTADTAVELSRLDGAVRQASNDFERSVGSCLHAFPVKSPTHEVEDLRRQVRQASKCLMLDLTVLAIGPPNTVCST